MRNLILAALCALPTPTLAAEIVAAPKADSIQVGDFRGVVYFTEAVDGFHVVATISVLEGPPIRFKATLAEGERLIISTPGLLGEADNEVAILRDGDKLVIADVVPETALAIP